MISEMKWRGTVAMKNGLDAHASDLISSGQGIELDGGVYCHSRGVLCSYHSEESQFVFRSSDCCGGSFYVHLADITSITVLSVMEININLSEQPVCEY